MKTKYEKVYNKLYCYTVEDFYRSVKELEASFVFQGSGNWEMYCTKESKKIENNLFENVELVGFDTLEEVNAYEIDRDKIIDFSQEHTIEADIEKYFLLIQR